MTDNLSIYYVNLGKVAIDSYMYDLTLRQVFGLSPDVIIFIEHPFGNSKNRFYIDGYNVTFSQYVAVCYRTSLACARVPVDEPYQKFSEFLMIHNLVIGGVYFHPEHDPLPITEAVSRTLKDTGITRWFIASDVNAAHPSWDFSGVGPSDRRAARGTVIADWVQKMGGYCLNTYTSYGSFIDHTQNPAAEYYIDIMAAHKDILSTGWSLFEDITAKDHRGMHVTLVNTQLTRSLVYRTHWNSFRKFISSASRGLIDMENSQFIDQAVRWYEHVLESAQKAKRSFKITHKTPIWWTENYLFRLAHLKRLKNRSRKNKNNVAKREAFHAYREEFRKFSKKLRAQFFQKFLADLQWTDSRKLGRKINFLRTKRREKITPSLLVGTDNVRISAKKTPSTLLEHYFLHVNSTSTPTAASRVLAAYLDRNSAALRSSLPPIHNHEFLATLSKVKNNTAPGLDGLTKRHLVNLDYYSRGVLLRWYNTILTTGIIPKQWKVSKVIFIPKVGKSQALIQNWRPISLTNIMFRIFDKIIANRVAQILEQEQLLDSAQHGFRNQRGIETYFSAFFTRVDELKLRGRKVGLVSLDFSKAFDKVDVPTSLSLFFQSLPPMSKFHAYLPLLLNYVSNRVVTTNFASFEASQGVNRGIPQGGALSPHIFNIIIRTLLSELQEAKLSFEYLVFADDILLLVHDTSYERIEATIQRDLPTLCNLAAKHSLFLNTDKTQYMRYTNRLKFKSIDPLTLSDGVSLPSVSSLTVLGVTLEGSSTSPHWDKLLRRGTAQINRVVAIGRIRHGMKAKFQLNVVRSLCFSQFLWCTVPLIRSMTKDYLDRLNILQATASRSILGVRKQAPRFPSIALCFGYTLSDLVLIQFLLTVLFNPHVRDYLERHITSRTWKSRASSLVALTLSCASFFNVDAIFLRTRVTARFPRPVHTYGLIHTEVLCRQAALERAHPTKWNEIIGFTDGSYLPHTRKSAWAFVFYLKGASFVTRSGAAFRTESIFWAELTAILEALKYVHFRGYSTCRLFCDSLGAIKACSSSSTQSEVINEIWDIIKIHKITLYLHWCPSHSEAEGNEAADQLARTRAMISPSPILSYRKRSFRSLLLQRAKLGLLESWRQDQPKSILRSQRALHLYHRQFFAHPVLTQIILNCSQLRTSLQYVNSQISPFCSCTSAAETVRPFENLFHLLRQCPQTAQARRTFESRVGLPYNIKFRVFLWSIFQDVGRVQALINFFRSTRLLRPHRLRDLLAGAPS